jgi:hypothetical protein
LGDPPQTSVWALTLPIIAVPSEAASSEANANRFICSIVPFPPDSFRLAGVHRGRPPLIAKIVPECPQKTTIGRDYLVFI